MAERGISTRVYKIRKLTPRECFRLQGLTFEDCDKASAAGVSNSQLYSQAGNGIITNCIQLLMEHLFKAQYYADYVCMDERILREQEESRRKQYEAYVRESSYDPGYEEWCKKIGEGWHFF